MKNVLKSNLDFVLILPFVLVLTLVYQNAWIPSFFQDGYLYAAFGKNAAELGHWLVPHLSESTYNRFSQHIPFIFILEGIFFKVFGASYITARIFGGLGTIFIPIMFYKLFFKEDKNKFFFIMFVYCLTFPLIKKSRFPNLDIFLMFFNFMAQFFVMKAKDLNFNKNWFFAGFFLGLCFLTKGPIGILTLFSVFMYLVVDKRLDDLKKVTPWLALVLSFLIFLLWPISLKLSGNYQIFQDWINSTFVFTIKDSRGVQEYSFFTYFVFLFGKASIPIIFSLVTGYYLLKKKIQFNSIVKLSIVSVVCFLIPLSVAKFKYSHYIIPIYPFLAILGGLGLHELSKSKIEQVRKVIMILMLLAPIVLLTFPLTNKIKRDKEINYIQNFNLHSKRVWLTVGNSYPFFALANKVGFDEGNETFQINEIQYQNLLLGNTLNLESEGQVFSVSPDQVIVLTRGEFKSSENFQRVKPNFYTEVNIQIHKKLFK